MDELSERRPKPKNVGKHTDNQEWRNAVCFGFDATIPGREEYVSIATDDTERVLVRGPLKKRGQDSGVARFDLKIIQGFETPENIGNGTPLRS
jgi:hypothetical protein